MWPMLLNMTRDECRLTLRRLELEAYSNMISVFRAQGALEDNRKKLLEELRAVLHISNDRHSAEARRVSNDELLATIAERLSGPNTGLGWIREGRRRVPLLPRGVAQSMYTEIADKAAEQAAAENREIQKRLEAEKLIAPKSSEEEITDAEGQTAEALTSNESMDETMYPPIAMEDQTTKLWETEIINERKRKIPEGGSIPDDSTIPVKNMRNITMNTNQKHLNLSQIYSKLSQPAPTEHIRGKPPGQSKHSYNQVSKVSTSKSSQSHAPRSTPHKPRAHKGAKAQSATKSQKKTQEVPISPNKQYNPVSLQLEFSGPPNTFQASYAQSILGNKSKADYLDEMKPKVMSSPSMMTDSPTMQLLTQPATVPHELEVSDNSHPDDPSSLQAQSTPVKHTVSGKPCQLIIKNRGEISSDKKVQIGELKLLQKPADNIKLLSNRQVLVAPSSAQKALNTPGKLVTTKVIGSIPKARTSNAPVTSDKMIVVSKSLVDNKKPPSKVILTSNNTPHKEFAQVTVNSASNKTAEALTPKGIPATDLKVSAKAVVLNPKSGQKMVVLPAKARTKTNEQIPLLHFKGIPTAMKLVPVSSQSVPQSSKAPTMTVISKPPTTSSIPSSSKLVGLEPIKTANLADIVPVKGLAPITTPKITNPIVRPSSTKGSVIVVQKGTPLGKALTFAKNGNDMSKIIMGKNVNQLLQASKTETEAAKCSGNVIVLELNNDQSGRTTTMSEILDSRSNTGRAVEEPKKMTQITPDTPVLFDNQMTEETCNASSLDSTGESIGGIVPMEETVLPMIEKEERKASYSKDETAKDSSSVTDWEMELDTVSRKNKDDDDKLNSLHLDLGMSSDSDTEYMASSHKTKSKHSSQESIQRTTPGGENSEMYSSTSAMSLANRTLLSQLQDDGSSSNDSSFTLKAKIDKVKESDSKLDRSETDALTKAKEKLSEKVAEAKSQQKRIDIYSTAITTADINLDSFSYLDEGMMAGDDVFAGEDKPRTARLHELSRLLADDSANESATETDDHTVSQNLPLNKST
ncbi:LOW QUALITY PROTEIN: BRCA2-interacting transcriptional repressor EMSY [Manduca sexta]|uniref:ENT domain-containing protein n=1 Tax=Manduca sexta TaxID=7130 RepID=A0A921Z4T4_MANSE|nr:LOW QUALITY PROTEIN: BRCA2-interacting transcriptional repressor EMSY [Manduca sexta]KAG6450414.1 hypothetical protein O3G_MSEX006592 [Manduca sexta]